MARGMFVTLFVCVFAVETQASKTYELRYGQGYGELGYGEKGYGENGQGYGEHGNDEKGYGEHGYGEKGYGEHGYGEVKESSGYGLVGKGNDEEYGNGESYNGNFWERKPASYYYYRNHGPKLAHGRFTYRGKSFRLRCNANRWYTLWNDCYYRNGSTNRCLGRFYRKHYFIMQKAAYYAKKTTHYMKKTAAAHVAAVNKISKAHKAAIKTVANKHLKTMKAVGYRHVAKVASISKNHLHRFHKAVSVHLNKLTHHIKKQLALKRQQHKKHMAEREAQHRQNLLNRAKQNKVHKHYLGKVVAGAKKALSYDYLYTNRYHGFKLVGKGFRYRGRQFGLRCGKGRFQRYWNTCYSRRHSVSGCFGALYRRHYFGLIKAGEAKESGGYAEAKESGGYGEAKESGRHAKAKESGGYESGRYAKAEESGGYGESKGKKYAPAAHDYHYYYSHKYHGFPIVGNCFSYKGKAYVLKYNRPKFERYWNLCYSHVHSVGRCFNALYKRSYFALKTAKRYLKKVAVAHKYVAAKHVKALHTATKTHVASMNNLAVHHVSKMKAVANKHTKYLAAVTNQSLHKLKTLIKKHIHKLKVNTHKDLAANAAQHKKQLAQRAVQNKKHIVQKAIQNKQHKYYLTKTIKHAAYAAEQSYGPYGESGAEYNYEYGSEGY